MADVSVRPATPDDSVELARIQAAVWARVHEGELPEEVLAAVGSAEAAAQWRAAAGSPPTGRHRVMTAVAGDAVVGFAALAPASDPDLDPAVDAELLTLCVDPTAGGAGHGSRLVKAAADLARGDGFHHLHAWLSGAETDLRAFLAGAGWDDDGATRCLDLRGDGAVLVEQARLRTTIVDQ
jgi:GNAT superfamily N-acetyltransferase